MAKLVFGMNQSLDGYVDHMAFAPSPTLFRHFIKEAQGQAGSVYGRRMYEVSHCTHVFAGQGSGGDAGRRGQDGPRQAARADHSDIDADGIESALVYLRGARNGWH